MINHKSRPIAGGGIAKDPAKFATYKASLKNLESGDHFRRSAVIGARSLESSLFAAGQLQVGQLLNADIAYLRGLLSRINVRGLLSNDKLLVDAQERVGKTTTLEAYVEAIRTLKRVDFAKIRESLDGFVFDTYFHDLMHYVSGVVVSSIQTHSRYLYEQNRR